MDHTTLWIGFGILIVLLLVFDLGYVNKIPHAIRLREALIWSTFWIVLGLLFGFVVYLNDGYENALQYVAAYFMEKSLSVDNLFVFLMIFTFFKVPDEYQHRVLFWGIIGALAFRFIFIFAGIALIKQFDWILYIFGVLLIYSGYKMIKEKNRQIHPDKNPIIKYFRKIFPVTSDYMGGKFLTRVNAKLFATPLLVVLLVIETTDIVFAVDSIPAVLGISQDTFIVYTSNIMAILGLRALYFALSVIMKYFHYLHYSLAAILAFVGLKMLLADFIHIPIYLSLCFIVVALAVSIILSIINKQKAIEKVELQKVE